MIPTICVVLMTSRSTPPPAPFSVGDTVLPWSVTVRHLGHVIACDITDEKADIERARKALLAMAFQVIRAFRGAPPALVADLVRSHCAHMYGSALWSAGADLAKLAVALNSITAAVYRLPRRTHRCLFRDFWPFIPWGLKNAPGHSCEEDGSHNDQRDAILARIVV